MKEFIKGRWFPLLVATLIVAVVAFVMALFGWRVTYAPQLENSWNATSAVGSLLGAVGTIAATWFAVISTIKQDKQNKRYQEQNKGLDLYSVRRNALKLLEDKKYDEMYWDAVLLFRPEVADRIATLRLYMDCYQMECELLGQYEQSMEDCNPELYKEYQILMSECEDSEDSDDILELCDKFVPRVYMPQFGEYEILNYREIQDSIKKARLSMNRTHSEVMDMMKNEIISSIQ